jgi:hypothetical protein
MRENFKREWVALHDATQRAQRLGSVFRYADVNIDIMNALRTGSIPVRGVCGVGRNPQRIEKLISEYKTEIDFILNTVTIFQESSPKRRMKPDIFSLPISSIQRQTFENVEAEWSELESHLLENCIQNLTHTRRKLPIKPENRGRKSGDGVCPDDNALNKMAHLIKTGNASSPHAAAGMVTDSGLAKGASRASTVTRLCKKFSKRKNNNNIKVKKSDFKSNKNQFK